MKKHKKKIKNDILFRSYEPKTRESYLSISGSQNNYFYFLNCPTTQSMHVFYHELDELDKFEMNFSENALTKLSMESSIKSFHELWSEEDDEYWSSYLDE